MRRKILFATAALLLLLLGLFLFRGPLLAPILRSQLQQRLALALDAEVRVGEVGGNLLDEVEVSGIQITGKPGALLSRLRDGRVSLDFRLLGLVAGEADAIQRVTVDCGELVLDAAGTLPSPPAESAAAPSSAVPDLHDLLPGGARVHVASLSFRHGDSERRAPLEMHVAPLAPTREVTIRHGRSHLKLSVSQGAALQGSIEVPDTGDLLRACGFDNDLEGGLLRAVFAASPERLQVAELVVTVPGLRLTGEELNVPFQGDAIGQATGRVALDVADLEQQAARLRALPPAVRGLLPNRGRMRAHIAGGKLVVEEGRLSGKDLEVEFRRGRLSLAPRLAGVSGSIGFTVTAASPVVVPLPGDRSLQVAGQVEGEVTGSVADPSLRAEARLGEVRYQGLLLRGLDASLQAAGNDLSVELREAALRLVRFDLGPVTWQGRLGLDLAAAGGPKLSTDLRGKLDPRWLGLAGLVPPGRDPIGFRVSGEVDLPSGGPASGPVGEAELVVPELRLDSGKAWRLSLAAGRDRDGTLRVEELLLSGRGSLRVEGRYANRRFQGNLLLEQLQLDELAFLFGLLDLRGSVDGSVSVAGTVQSPGVVVDLTGSVAGLGSLLPAAVARRLPDGVAELRLAGEAGVQGCHLKALQLAAGESGAPRLQVEMQGYLPLRWQEGGLATVPAGERPDAPWLHGRVGGLVQDPVLAGGALRHELEFALREEEVHLKRLQLELQGDAGTVRVTGKVGLDAEDLRKPGLLDLVVELEGLRLERLPPGWVEPFALSGEVSGRLAVAGPGLRPRVRGVLSGKDLGMEHPRAPAVGSGQLQLRLEPAEVTLERFGADVGGTALELSGRVAVEAEDFWQALQRPATPLSGELRLRDLSLALLPGAPLGLEEVGGLLSGTMQVAGTLGEPEPTAKLSLREGRARAAGRPALAGQIDVAMTAHSVKVTRCAGTVGETAFTVTAELVSPEVVVWRLAARPDARVQGGLQVESLTLDALPRAWTGLDDLRGRVGASLELRGSLRKPQPEGRIQVEGGSVKLPGVPRLGDLQGTLRVSPSTARLEGRGTLGAGPLRVEGGLDCGGRLLVEADESSKVTASLVGRDLLLFRGPGTRLRADTNLSVAGSPKEMKVEGRVEITSAKFQRRLSLLPDPRLEGGTALSRIGPLSLGPPLGERLRFRVAVVTREPVVVRTHVLDADLDVALELIGPGNAMQLQGAVNSRQGVLRFPGSTLRLETARVVFDPRMPARPELMVNAAGRRYGYEIRMQASGRPGDLEVEMSSVPPLPPREVMVLVTTGVPPDQLANRETRANVSLVGSYLLGELLGSFFASESLEKEADLAERFTFEFGNEVSRQGEETWLVEYDLSHLGLQNLAARVEQDIYEDQSINLIYRMRF